MGDKGPICADMRVLMLLLALSSALHMADSRVVPGGVEGLSPAPAPGPLLNVPGWDGGEDVVGADQEPPQPGASDLCADAGLALQANRGVVKYEVALACQESFPFNLTVALRTIDTLKKVLPFYVFQHIARRSPTPLLPSRVRLNEGLSRISSLAKKGWFWNEYDFDTEIHKLFMSLNDGHMEYAPRCSIGSWRYTHGMVLMGVVKDGVFKIKVAPSAYQWELLSIISTAVSADLLSFADSEVVAIDSVPSVKYLLSFADSDVGLAKDLNARLNKALLTVSIGTQGNPIMDRGTFFQQKKAPLTDTVTFSFLKPGATSLVNITIPYHAYYLGSPFSSSSQYWTQNCAPIPPVNSAQLPTNDDDDVEVPIAVPDIQNAVGDAAPLVTTVRSGIVSGFVLPDLGTGVVVIPTTNNGAAALRPFQNQLAADWIQSILRIRNAGATRLILDLTQNGGGDVFLGYWMVATLFPGVVTNLPTIMRAGFLPALMARTASSKNASMSMYHWSKWASAKTNLPFTSAADGFFFPLVNRTYGGVTDKYSQPFKDVPAQYLSWVPKSSLKSFGETPPFAAKDILILTNGYCGSTCSLITSSLSQLFGVRTVTVGGVPGTPQQVSNMPGGQVMRLTELQDELKILGLGSHRLAPKPLMRNAKMTFTWRMVFGLQSDVIPLEFLFTPSTFNLDYTEVTAISPFSLWQDVCKLF